MAKLLLAGKPIALQTFAVAILLYETSLAFNQ